MVMISSATFVVLCCAYSRVGCGQTVYVAALEKTMEQIHVEHAQSLDAFAGDAAPFEKTRLYLEDCLRTQTGSPSGRQDEKKVAPLTMIVGVVVVLLLVWMTVSTRNRWQWEDYLAQLKAEPGIIVVSTDTEDGKYVIRGLRDPLAADPIALLRATPIPPEQVVGQWEPYQSLAPSFVLARAKALLMPPTEVTLRFADGVLFAAGVASAQWIADTRKLAGAIPGATKLNDQELIDADARARALKLKELQAAKAAIEQMAVYFTLASSDLAAEQDQVLTQLTTSLRTLFVAARFVGYEVQVDVVGHTDGTGIPQKNVVFSQQRAARIIAELARRGLPAEQRAVLQPRASGPRREEKAEQDLEANRSVTFEVRVDDRQK